MLAAGIVFKASADVDFVLELAGWVSPPTAKEAEASAEGEEAPAQEGDQEALQASAFQVQCADLESREQFIELDTKLEAALKERFDSAPESDVECAYTILLQLLLKWEMLPSRLLALATDFGSNTTERTALRRKLLLSLLSLVQQCNLKEMRFPMLMKLISYCSATQQLEPLLGGGSARRMATIEKWVREWRLSTEQQRELWGVIFDTYAADADATFDNALKYFPLNDGLTLASEPALKQRLVSALTVTIRSPDRLNCDKLAALPVVQQLSNDADHAVLARLVAALATGMYSDYVSLYKQPATAAYMEKHTLSHAVCERKTRLLTIVSLAHASKELRYDDVAAALGVPEPQVEAWVVEAICLGLIHAKMDQVERVVVVSLALERDFGEAQLHKLKASLAEWGKSVHGLVQVVGTARPTAAA